MLVLSARRRSGGYGRVHVSHVWAIALAEFCSHPPYPCLVLIPARDFVWLSPPATGQENAIALLVFVAAWMRRVAVVCTVTLCVVPCVAVSAVCSGKGKAGKQRGGRGGASGDGAPRPAAASGAPNVASNAPGGGGGSGGGGAPPATPTSANAQARADADNNTDWRGSGGAGTVFAALCTAYYWHHATCGCANNAETRADCRACLCRGLLSRWRGLVTAQHLLSMRRCCRRCPHPWTTRLLCLSTLHHFHRHIRTSCSSEPSPTDADVTEEEQRQEAGQGQQRHAAATAQWHTRWVHHAGRQWRW